MLCLSCVAQQSNVMSIEPNWEARTLEHGTSLGATNGYDKNLLCHHLCRCPRKRHTVRIVKGVTVLSEGVARSSCAPSSNTWFLSTFPADKMITNDTDTQRKQWKSSCQTSTNLLNQNQNPLSQHAASCVWEVPRGAHCWQGCHMETRRFDQQTWENAKNERR